jgi:hypothetical protein
MGTLDKIRALVDARIGSPDPKIPTLNVRQDDRSTGSFNKGQDFIQRNTVVGTPTKLPGTVGAGDATSSSGGTSDTTVGDGMSGDDSDRYGDKDKHDLTGKRFKGTFSRDTSGES